MPRANGWLRVGLSAAGGAVSLVAGVGVLTDPAEDPTLGWAFLALAVGVGAVPFWFWLARGRGAVFAGRGGVVLPNGRLSSLAMVVTVAGFGVSGILLSRSAEPVSGGDSLLLVIGLFFLVLVAPAMAVLVLRDRGVVLTPEAVVLVCFGKTLTVPWDTIVRVQPFSHDGRVPSVRLFVRDERGGRPKKLVIGAQNQRNDPALVLWAVVHYLAVPGDRGELVGGAGVERLVSGGGRGGLQGNMTGWWG